MSCLLLDQTILWYRSIIVKKKLYSFKFPKHVQNKIPKKDTYINSDEIAHLETISPKLCRDILVWEKEGLAENFYIGNLISLKPTAILSCRCFFLLTHFIFGFLMTSDTRQIHILVKKMNQIFSSILNVIYEIWFQRK